MPLESLRPSCSKPGEASKKMISATNSGVPIRVLYSFPHKLGAGRICTTAWHQVDGLAAAGADVTVFTGSICRPLPVQVKVRTTLSWKRFRIPYRLLGSLRACMLHDWLVASQLKALAGKIDVVHVWPLGALRTIREAKRLGMTTVLERPNAHTRYAYEAVRKECERLNISMPSGHEHAYNEAVLSREEAEYQIADWILCPSDFVARTFVDQGFPANRLLRHQYGFNDKMFFPETKPRDNRQGLRILFAGGCAPRKGLHFALEAWLRSPAHEQGVFLIGGEFIPAYAKLLSAELSHPSVKVLGHRKDLADLMRQSDILVLPSIEEGSALVTSEARGCGCVLLVSDAAGAICENGKNALVHSVGDVQTLTQHLTMLNEDRDLLAKLREASLKTVHEITWDAGGRKLEQIYQKIRRTKAAKITFEKTPGKNDDHKNPKTQGNADRMGELTGTSEY
jgi:glycosyltransferase involved in cell wall biosynthesis